MLHIIKTKPSWATKGQKENKTQQDNVHQKSDSTEKKNFEIIINNSSEEQAIGQKSAAIPDGGYGWVIVVVCFLTSFCCWGGNAGFAVYLANYVTENTFSGTNLDYAAIGGLAFGTGLLFAPVITYIIGLLGTNVVMFIGACIQLAAMLLASFSTKLWQIYLTQGVLMGFGLAVAFVPVPPVIPQWFDKKRSLAMGLGVGGSGAGGVMFNLAMQKILEVKSVRWALRAQAIICFVLLVLSSVLIRTRNAHIKPVFKLFDKQILEFRVFWVFVGFLIFSMFGYVVVQYELADATMSLGYSAYQGSIASALIATGAFFLRPAMGFFSDKFGCLSVGIIVYYLCGILTLAMWIPARNLATIYAYAILCGGLMGYIWGFMGAVIPRMIGLRKASVTFGMSWMFLASSAIVSPIIGLAVKQNNTHEPLSSKNHRKSEYIYAGVFAGLGFICCATCLVFVRGYIIARDILIMLDEESDDIAVDVNEDLLKYKVPFALWMKHLFTIKTKNKV
ncbi:related to Probable transporter MCH2 [Saccharomycodes ludwigii]|uniref:Related to Probable transporter MCH2 n=1 Tax=Saccharomycodes ludwigii TaxID=36035 RepID=A0A376B190_9ASCO|nr:related to Probable transporter MCH2 [Saccharomycodes ludwigii]